MRFSNQCLSVTTFNHLQLYSVCMALQAIAHCTGPDLVSVFLPQVINLLRHDRDLVKKKALLALHRLLQIDKECGPDIERHLVEKLGHKDPSVMVAALCGLHELASRNPAPYRNLVHYFTNILKQAAEGKLGRTWDYHRAPAPFVQIKLLRLLSVLGDDNAQASADMHAVLIDVWRRAEALPSTVGNALVYECMRTASKIQLSNDLVEMALESVARLLKSKENNLKYVAIDILSRLVARGVGQVQQHQIAIIDCLHSADSSLKRKTLDLLFKIAVPGNVDIIVQETLAYVKDSTDDEVPRRSAAEQLLEVAESLAPSVQWYVEVVLSLLDSNADVIPPLAVDALLRTLSEVNGGSENAPLQRHIANHCFLLLDRAKLPIPLLVVSCWILGEYGMRVGKSMDVLVEKLTTVAEMHIASPLVLLAVAMALGKLASSNGRILPSEAKILVETLTKSTSLDVAQIAMEILMLQEAIDGNGGAKIHLLWSPSKEHVNNLEFLNDFVQKAVESGAAPYLEPEQREQLGVSELIWGTDDTLSTNDLLRSHGPALKFEAYKRAETKEEPSIENTKHNESEAVNNNLFEGLELDGSKKSSRDKAEGDNVLRSPQEIQRETKLMVDKSKRRWGFSPSSAGPKVDESSQKSMQRQDPSSSNISTPIPRKTSEGLQVDPAKQLLAASLFSEVDQQETGRYGLSHYKRSATKRETASSGVRSSSKSNRPMLSRLPAEPQIVDLLGESFGDTSSFNAQASNTEGGWETQQQRNTSTQAVDLDSLLNQPSQAQQTSTMTDDPFKNLLE